MNTLLYLYPYIFQVSAPFHPVIHMASTSETFYYTTMSVAASLGSQGLFQLGVSVSDIAFVYEQGRKVGNWFFTKKNDEDLLDLLAEDPESLVQRRGLVEPIHIMQKFPHIQFIYHEGKRDNKGKTFGVGRNVRAAPVKTKGSRITSLRKAESDASLPIAMDTDSEPAHGDLRPYSWLMVIVVSALDLCLPSAAVTDVLVSVFTNVLNDETAEEKLRVALSININSWRDFGQVRGVVPCVKNAFLRVWNEKTGCTNAIAQLNQNEEVELKRFLQDLLEDKEDLFLCHSASTFAIANALEKCGISIKVSGDRQHEGQLLVEYVPDSQTDGSYKPPHRQGIQTRHRLQNNAQLISYPRENPESMIQAVGEDYSQRNAMEEFWTRGAKAAAEFALTAASELPYDPQSPNEVYYELCQVITSKESHRVSPTASILASRWFPCKSDKVLMAIESLLQGVSTEEMEWLDTHSGTEFLLRSDSTKLFTDRKNRKFSLWLKYQALVFGFYYRLLKTLVTLRYVDDEAAYFRGLWGETSTTFLAMCTCFGKELNDEQKVSRTHVLYLLASMYNGRPKIYNKNISRQNLVGVMGKITVVAMPLIHTCDVPKEMSSFVILDLPISHLVPETDGELYASPTCSIAISVVATTAQQVYARSSIKKWTVHSTMSSIIPQCIPGVVMVARCEGRLVGWFPLLAAETMFLSTAYMQHQHGEAGSQSAAQGNEHGRRVLASAPVTGFEIQDKDWQSGVIPIPRTTAEQPNAFGVVHSLGFPALRFAAAGFYAGLGEEVAIANGDMEAAFARVEGQEHGIIIA